MAKYRKILSSFSSKASRLKHCEHPGCDAVGDYKAPRDRDLQSYYHFCLEHVVSYNARWDYYSGMNEGEIESDRDTDRKWRRPTWPFSGKKNPFKPHWHDPLGVMEGDENVEKSKTSTIYPYYAPHSEEGKALLLFDIRHPLPQGQLRERYLVLVKQYHPDHHPDDPRSEAKLKAVTIAYHVLKKIAPVE